MIDAAIERHDPAVEQFAGRKNLPAEVVDDQNAVVGFHLARRDETPGSFVQLQFQHLRRQLAAHRNARPFADGPPRVPKTVIGKLIRDLPNPFEPLEVLAHLGYRLDCLTSEEAVLLAPPR